MPRMSYLNIPLFGHEITFAVGRGRGEGILCLAPCALLRYHDGSWQGHYLEIRFGFRERGWEVIETDYLLIGDIEDLYQTLERHMRGIAASLHLFSVEGA